jgi:starch synthase
MRTKKSNKAKISKVWMVSREYDGLAGAGGVKDVCRQLAETLAGKGRISVRVVMPRYGFMNPAALGFKPLRLSPAFCDVSSSPGMGDGFDVDMNYAGENRRERVTIWEKEQKGVTVYLVETERFAEKLGVYTYTVEEERLRSWQHQGMGHYDYFAMNILLQKAALGLMLVLGERPEVIHCQDGHAAVLPAMLREMEGYRHFFTQTGTVVTIHNAGTGYHQDVADLHFARAITGLPEQVINAGLLGRAFDPLIVAAGYAIMNTVSENYARELEETTEDIRTGWLGHNLRQMGASLAGVTNGINPMDFDPTKAKKLGLPASFDVLRGKMVGKRICKENLLRSLANRRKRSRVEQFGRLSLNPDLPLLTFIGRLTEQKGVDLLINCFTTGLLNGEREFQLLVLGDGNPEMESRLSAMAGSTELAGRMCFLKGYDQDLATKVYAAGDFFLIPSLYEPCGLTDYIAQLLGNLPIVHRVGGLVKVIDGETGFVYDEHSPAALAEALGRALVLYRRDPDAIGKMQRQAVHRIREHHTWEKVMLRYLELYQQAMEKACPGA